ncbi:hypothetical protein E5676_scaffold134G002450 [Cucumis melo var. makuwa]|uniref:Uncharacterized protein n=2 Tax=Cucumis melo TaxID=3656 RepID=A0A5A7VA56_CUCMM|nr:hypothetical protein E6C27_scaffold255G001830 [Cucumis melo var. makuwa]TYK20120.1 hypothetical protein E5676_scaffold134G002450 [Cucumis melo var. makuwa]
MACNNKTHSRGRVAFSWENRPGVCKAAVAPPNRFCDDNDDDPLKKKLQPPPCTPARKGNKKLLQKDGGAEDPFLAAYRECTSEDDEKNCKLKKNKYGFGGWMTMNFFGNLSCKQLTAVRDDSLISSPVSKRTV